jgi:hypothetical protein
MMNTMHVVVTRFTFVSVCTSLAMLVGYIQEEELIK